MIPEGQPKYTDLIDIVIQSAKKTVDVEQDDGKVIKDKIIDEDIIWFKTGSVDSNTFGRMAFELKEWERMAVQCFRHMTDERAKLLANEILDIALSFRRSIDAKSSESQRDKHNSKSTLLDKINRNKVEKVYQMKGEKRRGILDSIVGKDREKDEENE